MITDVHARAQTPHSPVVDGRILLILVAGIGDFVLATPAIRALRRGFPDSDITLLTTPQVASLARACPHVNEVVTFDLRAYRPGERGGGWSAWRHFRLLTAELRSRRFGLAVNLYEVATWSGAARMALLLFRVGAQRTAGRWSGGRGIFFDVRSADKPHAMDAMSHLAASLGGQTDGGGAALWIPERSRHTAVEQLCRVGLSESPGYIVLHPSSNKAEARLPEDKAAAIGAAIVQATNLPVLLIGDRTESLVAERVAVRIGDQARSLAGQTDLLELAAIIKGAKAAVTTDSGPMHLAAAVGTPLTVLFGPADPQHFGPRGEGRIAILQGKAAPCDSARWHTDIQVDEIIRALLAGMRKEGPLP